MADAHFRGPAYSLAPLVFGETVSFDGPARERTAATMSNATEARIKDLKAKIYDQDQALAAQRAKHEAQKAKWAEAEAARQAERDRLLGMTQNGRAVLADRQKKG